MRKPSRLGPTALAAAALTLLASAAGVRAAAVPVAVNLTSLRTIQPYALEGGEDQVYFVVTGVAAGKEINERLPKDQTLPAAPKKPAVTDKTPLTAWKGELNDGEFALVTVMLVQGDGKDAAKVKAFTDQLTAASKGAEGYSKKSLAGDEDVTKLAAANVKAQRAVVAKVKDTLSRAAKTDHFGGLFNVVILNTGGKIKKRIDPVGLTFGEHYGTDVKVYSKLKSTRTNVLVQDAKGNWSQISQMPTNDDDTAVRVKMLETEDIKGGKEPVRHVTDYLVELEVTASGKPLKWELEGEQTGYDVIHTYWDYAE